MKYMKQLRKGTKWDQEWQNMYYGRRWWPADLGSKGGYA